MNGEVRVALDDVVAIAVEFYATDAEFRACVEAGTNAALALNQDEGGVTPSPEFVEHIKTGAAIALVMSGLYADDQGRAVFSW